MAQKSDCDCDKVSNLSVQWGCKKSGKRPVSGCQFTQWISEKIKHYFMYKTLGFKKYIHTQMMIMIMMIHGKSKLSVQNYCIVSISGKFQYCNEATWGILSIIYA